MDKLPARPIDNRPPVRGVRIDAKEASLRVRTNCNAVRPRRRLVHRALVARGKRIEVCKVAVGSVLTDRTAVVAASCVGAGSDIGPVVVGDSVDVVSSRESRAKKIIGGAGCVHRSGGGIVVLNSGDGGGGSFHRYGHIASDVQGCEEGGSGSLHR